MNSTTAVHLIDNPRNRTLKLALLEGVDNTYLNTVANLVRGLPDVVRVRVDQNPGQLEVLHCRGNQSLLQDIHSILLMVSTGFDESRRFVV